MRFLFGTWKRILDCWQTRYLNVLATAWVMRHFSPSRSSSSVYRKGKAGIKLMSAGGLIACLKGAHGSDLRRIIAERQGSGIRFAADLKEQLHLT